MTSTAPLMRRRRHMRGRAPLRQPWLRRFLSPCSLARATAHRHPQLGSSLSRTWRSTDLQPLTYARHPHAGHHGQGHGRSKFPGLSSSGGTHPTTDPSQLLNVSAAPHCPQLSITSAPNISLQNVLALSRAVPQVGVVPGRRLVVQPAQLEAQHGDLRRSVGCLPLLHRQVLDGE